MIIIDSIQLEIQAVVNALLVRKLKDHNSGKRKGPLCLQKTFKPVNNKYEVFENFLGIACPMSLFTNGILLHQK